MSRKTITFDADTEKFFGANPRQLAGYQATIQNNTNQTIVVTVTNFNLQDLSLSDGSISYGVPASGALSIVAGAFGLLSNPYQAWKLTPGAAATGTVEITEMG